MNLIIRTGAADVAVIVGISAEKPTDNCKENEDQIERVPAFFDQMGSKNL